MNTRMPMPMPRRGSGFSLIEILIAVVVLATGLLALTALQGRLAQASADAKVRSRMASVLTGRMDELRAAQYASIPPVMPPAPANGHATSNTTVACTGGNWVCTAQSEGGVSDLVVTHAYERFMSVGGVFVSSGEQPPNPATAEFKRITLTATWSDATGAAKRMSVSSVASPLSIGDNRFRGPPLNGTAGGNATVRQDNPAGPGVIPIAIGGGDATAASNPRPEVMGKNNNESIVGTRFDVLTYEGLSGPARIQRRVETAAVSCTCEYGAGGTNLGEIYRTAQWPAQWTGERYEVIVPTGNPAAPGQALASGPASGVTQSPLCTECCRDHHDAAENAEKFDPVRTGTYEHYNASLSPVGTSTGSKYIEACRLIRVDGFWRTASDMYAKHFGLINTTAVAGVPAKSGAPDPTAVTTYQEYVKGYLSAYNGTAPTIADAADGGQVSGSININSPPPVDERYLHARGLYVDYLHPKARERILKARLPANCTSGDSTECMLPFLPFTTINGTELSFWQSRMTGTTTVDNTILTVATGSALIYDPLQPTRGRTNAKSAAPHGATADAAAKITRSNAGVAIGPAVDPSDQSATGVDQQNFTVRSNNAGTGQSFSVRLSGPSSDVTKMAFYDNNSSNDPAVAWANSSGNANCNGSFGPGDNDPNDYQCNTFSALGIGTTLQISNYFREYTVSTDFGGQVCDGGVIASGTKADRPTFANYVVDSAMIGTTPASSITVANDAKTTETTTVVFSSIASGDRVDIQFTLTATVPATIASCTTQNGKQINNIVWNKPWLTP